MTALTGEALRAQGQADVIAADEALHRMCGDAIRAALLHLADSGDSFTAENVRLYLPDEMQPHSVNLLPAIIGGWASAGRITCVGMCKTTRRERRSSRNLVWRGSAP